MGQPIGSTLEVTYKGTLIQQTIMTVMHYQVLAPSTAADLDTEYDQLLTFLTTVGAGTLAGLYLAVMPENYTLQLATVQFIRPTRLVRASSVQNLAGLRDPAATANTAIRATFRTQMAGRQFVGGMSLPVSPGDYVNGVFPVLFMASVQALVDKRLENLVPAVGGGIYEPVLVHPIASALNNTRLTTGFVQDTVRVMRRRTVGLGI